MNTVEKTWYENYVQSKSLLRYMIGLISRYLTHLKYEYIAQIARRNGAQIGSCVVMPRSLAKKLNSNITIGNHVTIETNLIDTRSKLKIGNNVIIGRDVEILTVSHNIDSPDWEPKYYGMEIQDYVWIATKALILPSCRVIEYGAVIGGGSVVAKNVTSMSVISGNPAKEIRKRKCVHTSLPVERLLHGDYIIYKETYKKRKL